MKTIWIDFDNSPHVPFFKPIIEELTERNYSVILTIRDCFQVCSLADLFGLRYERIGRHYGKNRILKVAGTLFRALQLLPTLIKQKPDLALSHGSRSQILTASIMGIPQVWILDYEHIQMLPFIRKTFYFMPEVVYNNSQSLKRKMTRTYPGIKEDVYIPFFKPDARILNVLGINKKDLLVTIRPPATEAHYYKAESAAIFKAVIDLLVTKLMLRMVLLPRNKKQHAFIKKMWPNWIGNGKIIVPKHVVDGLNLIWYSDFVISGGGTMNREAAALGVPVYSIFQGKVGAVDKYLADSGRLTLLESVNDIDSKIILNRRHRPDKLCCVNRLALQRIIENIVKILDG